MTDRRRHLVLFAVLLGALWLLLSDGELSGLPFGVVFVALGCWLFVRVQPRPLGRINALQLLLFVPFFLYESLRGGLEVTRRVLFSKSLPQGCCIDYHMQLGRHDANILFINCVNLMPGTLSLGWEGNHVQIHLLDASVSPMSDLHALERRIARLFRLPEPRFDSSASGKLGDLGEKSQ